MPDGTTIPIFAPRIHKSNAEVVKRESESMIEHYTNKLIALSCATPVGGSEAIDELLYEVRELIDEMLDTSFKLICAENIILFPEECDDDLEVV